MQNQMIRTFVRKEQSADSRAARPLAGAAFSLYALLLAAFALPFLSVTFSSCGVTAESEPLTGWQLVQGGRAEIQTLEFESSTKRAEATLAIEEATSDQSMVARIEVAFLLVAMFLSLLSGFHARPRRWLATVLFCAGILVVLGYGALGFVALGDGTIPGVHYGYFLGLALVLAALYLDYGLVQLEKGAADKIGWPSEWEVLLVGLVALAAGALTWSAFGTGSFMTLLMVYLPLFAGFTFGRLGWHKQPMRVYWGVLLLHIAAAIGVFLGVYGIGGHVFVVTWLGIGLALSLLDLSQPSSTSTSPSPSSRT